MAGQRAPLPRLVPEVETETGEATHALSTSALVLGVAVVMFTPYGGFKQMLDLG
jgi:hypothetical protein